MICDSVDGDQHSYRIYCGDREFSSLQYGQDLYSEVAGEVTRLRSDHGHYPIHVTDIDIAYSLLDSPPGGRLQTIHYLSHKRYIELRLNKSLTEV